VIVATAYVPLVVINCIYVQIATNISFFIVEKAVKGIIIISFSDICNS
jgi:hypothetical protein